MQLLHKYIFNTMLQNLNVLTLHYVYKYLELAFMKYNHMPLQTNTTRSWLPIYSLLIGQGVMNTIFLYNVYTIILHDNINDTMLSSLSCIYQTHELL